MLTLGKKWATLTRDWHWLASGSLIKDDTLQKTNVAGAAHTVQTSNTI
jgi:hypothetical protein